MGEGGRHSARRAPWRVALGLVVVVLALLVVAARLAYDRWQMRHAPPLNEVQTREFSAYPIGFSPRGDRLLTGYGSPQLWSVPDLTLLGKIESLDERTMWFPEGGEVVASVESESVVYTSLRDASRIRVVPHAHRMDRYWGAGVSRDGAWLANWEDDGHLRVWYPADPSTPVRLDIAMPYTTRIAWSPDDRLIAAVTCESAAHSTELRVLRASDGVLVRRFAEPGDPEMIRVAFSPRGDNLALLRCGGLRILSIEDGSEIARVAWDRGVTSFAFSPDGMFLATGHDFDSKEKLNASVWSLTPPRSQLVRDFVAREYYPTPDSTDNPDRAEVAWSSAGDFIATGGYEGWIQLWRAPR